MPDITGSPAFDIAIGLGFVYFVFSLLVSTIQEAIAGIMKWRAKNLEEGLKSMLGGDPAGDLDGLVKELFEHPLIKTMYRDSNEFKRKLLRTRGERGPSYIAPRAFSLALVDVLAPLSGQGDLNAVKDEIEARIEALPDGPKRVMKALLSEADGDIQELRGGLERWFDDTMARVSGWYKRKSMIVTYVIAVAVTLLLNVNTLAITKTFSTNPEVLKSVVVLAEAIEDPTAPEDGTQAATEPVSTDSADKVATLADAGVPLGWSINDEEADTPEAKAAALDPLNVDLGTLDFEEVVYMLVGWALTIVAIGLGSPFWFDLLSRAAHLRSSGKPETP